MTHSENNIRFLIKLAYQGSRERRQVARWTLARLIDGAKLNEQEHTVVTKRIEGVPWEAISRKQSYCMRHLQRMLDTAIEKMAAVKIELEEQRQ